MIVTATKMCDFLNHMVLLIRFNWEYATIMMVVIMAFIAFAKASFKQEIRWSNKFSIRNCAGISMPRSRKPAITSTGAIVALPLSEIVKYELPQFFMP